jgi:hypothetical protein
VAVKEEPVPSTKEQPLKAAKSGPQLQVLDTESQTKPSKGKAPVQMVPDGRKSKDKVDIVIPPVTAGKKTHDELIEEYERKINKTKSLLEEEKIRVAKQPSVQEPPPNV